MRRLICGFVCGVAYVQTLAALPSFYWCLVWLVLACMLTWLVKRWRHLAHPVAVLPHSVRTVLLAATGVLAGVVWASLVAGVALSTELPKELEGRDITVVGVVDSLPDYVETGTRFVFKVDHVVKAPCCVRHIPKRIALSWYAGLRFGPTTHQTVHQATASNTGTQTGAQTEAPAVVIPVTSVPQVPHLAPGERWQLTVQLKRPHGNANPMGFDAELRALEEGVRAIGYVRSDTPKTSTTSPAARASHSPIKCPPNNRRLDSFVMTPSHVVGWLRATLRARIHAALAGQPYAGVIAALVVGDQKAITPESWDVFRRTGVSHLVAISGLHITLVAGTFATLFGALWRRSFFTRAQLPLRLPVSKASILAGVMAAWVYVLMAGFGVPAQRALYMSLVIACAKWFARLTPVTTVLMLALFVVVLCDPWAVLSSGFWLSFGAVGILMYTSAGRSRRDKIDRERLKNRSRLRQKIAQLGRKMRDGSRSQYVMTLGLLPLTMLLFGQYSLVSPIANAVAIPVVTVIVAPLSLLGSVLPGDLSTALLQLAHWVLSWLSAFLQMISDWPFAVWTTPLPDWWMFLLASIGVLLLLAPKGWPLRWLGWFGWMPLLFNMATTPKAPALWVTAFDVGQGMALLVETAHHRLLYDTGPSQSEEMDTGKRILLPYLAARGIDGIDTLMVSHSDDDHAGGALSVMRGVKVGHVVSSLEAQHPIALAARAYRQCVRGQHWEWDGVQFMVLHPVTESYGNPDILPNHRSCVLRITAGKHVMLLAGDIEAADEQALLAREYPHDLRADVLLAPHHGSGTSSTDAFLATVQPSVALFQMGYLNRFHHPKPAVWARYGALGVRRFRSDTDGAVNMVIDEAGMLTTSAYRQSHARYWYTH